MPDTPYLWYFAYGSNMNPARLFDERMAGAGIGWGRRIAARLEGWQLAFNKPWSRFEGASVANIMQSPHSIVHGTLNEIEPDGLEVLDRFEGVAGGHYRRHPVTVLTRDGEAISAITYVSRYKLTNGLKPARDYVAHLIAGRDLLPPDYVAMLERIPTVRLPPEKAL